MSATVTLYSDRVTFETLWRSPLESVGLAVQTAPPEAFGRAVCSGAGLVVDGNAEAYDEDELLTAIGLAGALGAFAAVQLPPHGEMAGIEDIVEEMVPGLVVRRESDVMRVAAALARRLDSDWLGRFEFVTVSPRGNEVLAVLGDGSAVLLPRPLDPSDDGSDVVSIGLGDEAASAVLSLASGATFDLTARTVAAGSSSRTAHVGNGAGNSVPIDGARLGARLRALRLAAGLTQAELARRTGIHRPNIARVEAGRHTPSLETLARIAKAIGVPTTRVLSED